jgi:hypothetical protein
VTRGSIGIDPMVVDRAGAEHAKVRSQHQIPLFRYRVIVGPIEYKALQWIRRDGP